MVWRKRQAQGQEGPSTEQKDGVPGFHRKPCPRIWAPGPRPGVRLGPPLLPGSSLPPSLAVAVRCCLGSKEVFFLPLPYALPPPPPEVRKGFGAAPRRTLLIVTASAFQPPSFLPSLFCFPAWLVGCPLSPGLGRSKNATPCATSRLRNFTLWPKKAI